MEYIEVLNKCELKELSAKKAYQELYTQDSYRKLQRAHFVILKIRINKRLGLTAFLAFLFAFPIPIGIVKIFLGKKRHEIIDESFPITYGQLINDFMLKNINIDIHTKNEVRIHIETF